MASAACSDEEFVKLFRELGSPQVKLPKHWAFLSAMFLREKSSGTETRNRASFVLQTFADHKRNA
jgi:hypothetical protein